MKPGPAHWHPLCHHQWTQGPHNRIWLHHWFSHLLRRFHLEFTLFTSWRSGIWSNCLSCYNSKFVHSSTPGLHHEMEHPQIWHMTYPTTQISTSTLETFWKQYKGQLNFQCLNTLGTTRTDGSISYYQKVNYTTKHGHQSLEVTQNWRNKNGTRGLLRRLSWCELRNFRSNLGTSGVRNSPPWILVHWGLKHINWRIPIHKWQSQTRKRSWYSSDTPYRLSCILHPTTKDPTGTYSQT